MISTNRTVMAAMIAMLGTTATWAQDPAPVPVAAAPPAAREKRICRSDTATGSVMAHRNCHTKAEWAAIDAANADSTSRYARDRDANGGPTGH